MSELQQQKKLLYGAMKGPWSTCAMLIGRLYDAKHVRLLLTTRGIAYGIFSMSRMAVPTSGGIAPA